jgi:hypothetical protein
MTRDNTFSMLFFHLLTFDFSLFTGSENRRCPTYRNPAQGRPDCSTLNENDRGGVQQREPCRT